jgi:KaiC/GvpD/RAD55 family RecA-like ATPase/Cdc6-like AAA superfamily ATPase
MKTLRPTTIIPPELYVERAADRQLDEIVAEMGRPGYILVARQMGKTNLLFNMKRNRQSLGDLVIYLDLSNRFETVRGLFRHIIDQIVDGDIHLRDECHQIIVAERETSSAEPNLEYDRHIRLILRAAEGRRIIVVLDEIDSLTTARYSNIFFAQIRSMYFARVNHDEYYRLTYVLSGVAEPTDLIKDKNISPFNIGEKIYLEDFTKDEVNTLIKKAGLSFSTDVVDELYSWISGNPRMTWDVCSELEDIERDGTTATKHDVKGIIDKLYLGLFSRTPIDHIRTLAKEDSDIRNAITLVRSGKGASLDEKARTLLYLAGISQDAGSDIPKLRNRVIDVALADARLGRLAESTVPRYDLYISYNRADQDAVQNVAQLLRRRGLHVFFDRWAFQAGQIFSETLPTALIESKAVAVFVGPSGMSSMQKEEFALSLQRRISEADFPVIPVFLPGAVPDLTFLDLAAWVDFRNFEDEPFSVEYLIRAAHGEPVGEEAKEKNAEVMASINPYRGLAPFQEEQAPLFFGRETYGRLLVNELSHRNFIAVVGAPGSGKSSLVQAGVVPRLRRGEDGRIWSVVAMTPGSRPVDALATALAPLVNLRPSLREPNFALATKFLAKSLAEGTVRLTDLIEEIVARYSGAERVLLVIDQWEELYTPALDEDERRQFIDQLTNASNSSPLSVILTLRSDFLDQTLTHRSLADALQGGIVDIAPMTQDELRRAIVEPARVVGLQFENKLVDRILEDVKRARDILPVLEFTLYALWETRKDGKLLQEGYDAIGRHRALIQRAEHVFEHLTLEQKIEIREVLVQLVIGNEPSVFAMRPRVSLDSLSDEGRHLVRQYVDAGLVVITRSADGQAFIQFTHESLARNWPQLQHWVEAYFMPRTSTSRLYFSFWRRRIILAFLLAAFFILAGVALYGLPRLITSP